MQQFKIAPKFSSKEAEFREMTKKWIIKKHERFCSSMPHLKDAEPLRIPKGTKDKHGFTLERMWTDAIWCQDCSLDPMTEFFELEFNDIEYADVMDNQGCGAEADWANTIFNEEFIALLPDLKNVLEA